MPALSSTMEQGSITAWLKSEGDRLVAGEAICEIETDKATVDFEVADDGYLARILLQPKDKSASKDSGAKSTPVKVGDIIGIVVAEKEDVDAFKNTTLSDFVSGPNVDATVPSQQALTKKKSQKENVPVVEREIKTEKVKPEDRKVEAPKVESTAKPADIEKIGKGDRIFISPMAKATAKKEGVDIESLRGKGTGSSGRIVNKDVLNFIASPNAGEVPKATFIHTEELESKASAAMPRSKKVLDLAAEVGTGNYVDFGFDEEYMLLAQNLTESKQNVPHYYLNADLDVSKLLALREQLNTENKLDISLNDFIIKASALSMKSVPYVNASFRGSEGVIRVFDNCNINLYTQLGSEAVTLNTIEKVNLKGLQEISTITKKMFEQSSENESGSISRNLKIGTFSILNLGMFGVRSVCPIVVYGQSAALGVGNVFTEVLPVDMQKLPKETKEEETFELRYKLTVTLSCDHRVLDGAVGAKWLQVFRNYIENPVTMLL